MSPRTKEQYEEIRKESQDKILSAALELFSNHGFHQTSVNMIAKKAGVSQGLLYRYFESKEALLDVIIKHAFNDIFSILPESSQFKTSNEYLQNFIVNILEEAIKFADHWRLFFILILHDEISQKYSSEFMQYSKNMVDYFKELFIKFGSPDPELDTFLFHTALDGIIITLILSPSDVSIRKIAERLVEIYFNKKKRKS
jgi:AcrR family transcriptional regulator